MVQLSKLLNQPSTATKQAVFEHLTALHVGKHVLLLKYPMPHIESFAEKGHCTIKAKSGAEDLRTMRPRWDPQSVEITITHGHYELTFGAIHIDLVVYSIPGTFKTEEVVFLITDDLDKASSFILAVQLEVHNLGSNILVFEDGCFSASDSLYQAIKGATFENLVLQDDLAEQIVADTTNFFKSRAEYAKYGLPWKRGIILVGDPGNGKTHTVKALINLLEVPTLYVKSFEMGMDSESRSIETVFSTAREYAPCFVIFEDLDSMINDKNRSFFLNELDGFAKNEGLFILATTNHPDRLDPALINRPSRFDRKYIFNLPEAPTRMKFLMQFSRTMQPMFHLDDSSALQIASITEDFTFAYLKELFLSSLMSWMNRAPGDQFVSVMTKNVAVLRKQIGSPWSVEPVVPGHDGRLQYGPEPEEIED